MIRHIKEKNFYVKRQNHRGKCWIKGSHEEQKKE